MANFQIRHFISARGGQRFSQLYSSDEPWPLFYPTAFILRSIRLKTRPNTQKVYLEAIQRLCEWETKNNIDLEVRFQRCEFLRPHEIDGLVQYIPICSGTIGITGSLEKQMRRS